MDYWKSQFAYIDLPTEVALPAFDQPIPSAMNILNGQFWVCFQMFANLSDVHIHTSACEIVIVFPNVQQGFLPRKYVVLKFT